MNLAEESLQSIGCTAIYEHMSFGGLGSCNNQTVQHIEWEKVRGDLIPWIIRIKKATYDRQRPRHTANMRVHI